MLVGNISSCMPLSAVQPHHAINVSAFSSLTQVNM